MKYAWLLEHNMYCLKRYLNAMVTGGRKIIFCSILGSHYNTCLKRPSLYCLIHFYKRYNLTTLGYIHVMWVSFWWADESPMIPMPINIYQRTHWLLKCPHLENTTSTFILFFFPVAHIFKIMLLLCLKKKKISLKVICSKNLYIFICIFWSNSQKLFP